MHSCVILALCADVESVAEPSVILFIQVVTKSLSTSWFVKSWFPKPLRKENGDMMFPLLEKTQRIMAEEGNFVCLTIWTVWISPQINCRSARCRT